MAQTHTDSGQIASVLSLGEALREHRTTAVIKARQLELVRTVLLAGASMPEHAARGEITLQCIEGCLELVLPAGPLLLQAGDLVHLMAHEPRALRGVVDASLLLTICLVPG